MGYITFADKSMRLELVLAAFLFLVLCLIVLIARNFHLKNLLLESNKEREKLEKDKNDINNQLIQGQMVTDKLDKALSATKRDKMWLENQLHEVKREQERLRIENRSLSDHLSAIIKKQDEASAKKRKELEIQYDMLTHPSRYFMTRKTVLGSRQELSFFEYLEEVLRKKSTATMEYVLLVQVSLHAYIQPIRELEKAENDIALRLLGGKNTDFLVCRNVPNASEVLSPVVAIEINGDQHDTNYKTIRNDDIKKALFDGLGIPLVSHKLGSNQHIEDEVAPYME